MVQVASPVSHLVYIWISFSDILKMRWKARSRQAVSDAKTPHTHTHTNLFLSQSSRGGGGIHLFQSRSDRLSLGRKSTRACSLKFRGTDSIDCRESGYNPRGSQSLSDAMQWDNQQSINQSISTQACNGTINRDFEDHVTLVSLRWEVQFGLSWGLVLIYGTWQDSTGFYTNNGFLT